MYKIKNKKHRNTYINELKLMKPVLCGAYPNPSSWEVEEDDQEFKVIISNVLRLNPVPAWATKDPALTTETQNKNKQNSQCFKNNKTRMPAFTYLTQQMWKF